MDITREDLIAILNGSNEVKAEFVRQHMPMCESEEDFVKTLQEAIDSTPETPEPGEPNGPTA